MWKSKGFCNEKLKSKNQSDPTDVFNDVIEQKTSGKCLLTVNEGNSWCFEVAVWGVLSMLSIRMAMSQKCIGMEVEGKNPGEKTKKDLDENGWKWHEENK